MINHILATSRIPWILEQKGIAIDDLLGINIELSNVKAHLFNVEDLMKFEGWTFKKYEDETQYGSVGMLSVNYEGIQFRTPVTKDKLPLIEN